MADDKLPLNRAMLISEINDAAADLKRLIDLAFTEGMVVRVTATAQVVAGREDLRPGIELKVTDPKKSR